MAVKRLHITVTDIQLRYLRRLSTKWGLDLTNTIRHSVMRSAEQEGLTGERTAKASDLRRTDAPRQ